MKFYSLVLAYVMFCGLASGAGCSKELSPGLVGLYDFSFLVVTPSTYIFIKSGGHTIEVIFSPGGYVEVLVDGQLENPHNLEDEYPSYESSVKGWVDYLCGPGFFPNERVSGFSRNFTASRVALRGTVSGHTSEDVVIADFNGDGAPDSASLIGNGISVALLGANGKTLSSTLYRVTGASVAQNIITADFNGDGFPDLAVTTGTFSTGVNPFPLGNVVILLGNGDGTFRAPVQFPAGPVGNSYLASGDFNGDGIIDLALTHRVAKGSGQVAVLLGKGDGSFGAAVDYPVGPSPFTLVAADFTGDGLLDLVALDAFGLNKVWVLPGRGDGTFQAAVASSSLTKEGYLGYADLNHDGNLDLVIADQQASAMEVMLGNGDGTFQAGKEYLIGANPSSIAIVPLLDGNTALLTADNASNNLSLAFISSDGVVHSPELQTVGAGPSAVATVDLNGDGRPDLVIVDPVTGQLYVKLANGTASFAETVAYPGGIKPSAIAIADLNGDGKPDVIAGDSTGLNVLLGKGDGTLGAMTTFSAGGALTSAAVADFNLDGSADVAAASSRAGGVVLFLGNGNGTFQSARTLAVPSALVAVVGDFNGDGKPDLAVSVGPVDFQTPGSIAILLGNGDGTFQAPSNIALPGPLSSTALAIGDLNGDGKPDLVTVLFQGIGSKISISLGNGDGTFQAPIQVNSNTAPPSISIADLNGDGHLDLLLADCCGLAEASYLLGKGDGTFQPEVQFPSGPNPRAIAVADFNGDGKPDLAIVGQVLDTNVQGTLAFWFNAFGSPASSGFNSASAVAQNPAGPSPLPNTREHR